MDNKENEELFIEKDKFKFLRILIFVILIGLLGYGIYLLYQKKFVDNKSIISEIIEEKQENTSKVIEKGQKNTAYKYNGAINIDIELQDKEKDITDTFKDINLNIEGELDLKNNISNSIVTTKYENDDLIYLNMYSQDKKTYLYLPDYYDKYIELDNYFVNDSNIYNSDDLKVISDAFYSSINKIIQNNEWIETKEEITIKDKKINTTKNSLILKNKQINDTLIDIYKDLKNNQDFINIIKNKYNPDIIDTIDESINDLSNNPYEDELTINLYLIKNLLNKDIIRYEILFKNLDLKLVIDNLDSDTKNISIVSQDFKFEITISQKIFNMETSINTDELKLNISAKFNMEPIKEVVKTNITNIIKIEDLKDDDLNKITEKIGENNSFNKLMDHIAGIEARKEV